ncbi:hypothetical protein E2C01_080720 [Portunus trituberculatus]|uniref:Uncharacterized protein n=1 Tax=Portunus trituberculatus TaxID=210409 RepID=A0A5B7J0C4_PORTR|nr:hypothetical protein [Portunus trituberculatus]
MTDILPFTPTSASARSPACLASESAFPGHFRRQKSVPREEQQRREVDKAMAVSVVPLALTSHSVHRRTDSLAVRNHPYSSCSSPSILTFLATRKRRDRR